MARTALFVGTMSILAACGIVRGQLPPERFAPRSTLARFTPEDLPALASPAYFGAVEKAKATLFAGRYRQALYASFQLPDAEPIDVGLLRAEAYWRLGDVDLARSTLSAFDKDDRALLLLARIDLATGKYGDAVGRLKPLVEAAPAAVAPRHWLAVAYEANGDLDAAVAQHRTFAEGDDSALARFTRDGAAAFESAEDLTLAAASIDRWAAVTMQYKSHRDLHDTLLAMFVAAYDTVDRDYWPAHVAAARYQLAHGDQKDAAGELDAANRANPNSVDVNELMGERMIESRNHAGAEAAIEALRAVDPRLFEADVLEAKAKLLTRNFAEALTSASRAVDRQPNNLDALATLAAVHAARGDDAAVAATLARVDALAPRDAAARVLVAQTLSSVFYDSAGAVVLLETAVERAPWWTAAQHALGIALIQEGEENRARAVLDAAYAVDPYNLLTVNYLRVLDEMTKFKEFESARFIFRYAAQDDPIVPMYLAPQMDEMYDDLVRQFNFEPAKKPIVEVFPDAQSFSVRTAGLPGLETYGASLGRVMTVVAPRAGETLGPFNSARVLRHEFTHTLNLMYTHGRVPRWLTEGLAVWQEHVPYRFANVPEQLYRLASEGKMPTPRDMVEVRSEMHYMTGFWIVRYIDEQLGWPAVLKLLAAYRAGKEDDAAFTDATGMDVAAFHIKFSVWAKEQVSTWGYDDTTAKNAAAIEKEAERLTRDGMYEPAIAKWQAILKLQPLNPLPARRLAGIYLRLDKPAEALPHLIASLPLELQDDRFAKRVARIYDEAGDPTNAMKYAASAIGIDPYDADAHDLLATLYEKANDAAKAKQETSVAALLRDRVGHR